MPYRYYEESGYEEDLEADDMDEAVSLAEDLARNDDYGDEGACVSFFVVERDEAGNEIDRVDSEVEIEPNHDALIYRAGGDIHCDHDWTSEGEGGCRENPGVWSDGGTAMVFRSHCRKCGLHRTERTTGCQRNPGEHDTVSYSQPDK